RSRSALRVGRAWVVPATAGGRVPRRLRRRWRRARARRTSGRRRARRERRWWSCAEVFAGTGRESGRQAPEPERGTSPTGTRNSLVEKKVAIAAQLEPVAFPDAILSEETRNCRAWM